MELSEIDFKNQANRTGFIRIFLDHGRFGYHKMRIFYLMVGAINIIFTIFLLTRYWQGGDFNGSILIYGTLSFFMLFQALVTLHPKNAARIEIYEDKLLIKTRPFESVITFPWERINILHLRPYEVALTLTDGSYHSLIINTENPEISKKIKAFLRRLAMQKRIEING